MADAYALSNAVEHGLRTRAAIVDMRGQLNIRQWEKTASAALGHMSALKPLIWLIVVIVMKKSLDREVMCLAGLTAVRLLNDDNDFLPIFFCAK